MKNTFSLFVAFTHFLLVSLRQSHAQDENLPQLTQADFPHSMIEGLPQLTTTIYTHSMPNQTSTNNIQNLLVSASTVSCLAGQYILSDTDQTCKSCPAGKYRNVPTLWAPMSMHFNGVPWRYANRMNMNQPVYWTDHGYYQGWPGYAWWYLNLWIYHWGGGVRMDGSSCPCGNGGWPSNWGVVTNQFLIDGQYTPLQSVIERSTDISYCSDCPANLVCDPGTYVSYTCSDGRAATCAFCQPGTYSSSSGQSACTPCPVGTYSTTSGQNSLSSCTPCPVGTYSNANGQNSLSSCIPCPEGTYSNSVGQSICPTCPIGFFNNATGKTICTRCTNQ